MKIGSALLVVATFAAAADAKRLGRKSEAATEALDAAIAAEHPVASDEQSARKLQCEKSTAPVRWHPNYIKEGWADGWCVETQDCDTPGYDTELDCCTGQYGQQQSGACLSNLPSPPTGSPTESGGLGIWYPDYSTPWPEAGCINTRPKPSGWPEYSSRLACCKGAYGGQISGVCISQLPSPPTTSPTDLTSGEWWPNSVPNWAEGTCSNARPVPNNVGPTYSSQLACCKGAYGGQMSGACIAALPSPPTGAPTDEGDIKWYPDYDTAWSVAGCITGSLKDLGLGPGDRPAYDSELACCKGAYGGQMSGACISGLPSPPTGAPTDLGDLKWYPDYDTPWPEAGCVTGSLASLGLGPGDRPAYDSELACCKGAYGGQSSGACISGLDSPPTTAPTGADEGEWYAMLTPNWAEGTCVKGTPKSLGFGVGDKPAYSSQLACCKGAYGGQTSGACIADLQSPPTTSPTDLVSSVWYPDGLWRDGGLCINANPVPNNVGTFSTQQECCNSAFGGQNDDACQCDINPCHSCKCPGAASCVDLTCS